MSGVSAVVLATTVGVSAVGVSGALAQTAPNYEYNPSDANGVDYWADGPSRAANDTSSTDIATARSGDSLAIVNGRVIIGASADDGGSDRHSGAGKIEIGILRSGTSGAGQLLLSRGSSGRTVDVVIDQIQKRGSQAVGVLIDDAGVGSASYSLSVAGNAVVNDLSIDLSRNRTEESSAAASFNGNLTVEGATQIKAGNNSTRSIDAALDLKGANNRFDRDITLNDQAGGSAFLTLLGSADQRIVGNSYVPNPGVSKIARIKAADDGEGTIQVFNGRANQAPRQATFDIQIGTSTTRLKQLTIGDASKGGHAIFNRGVHVDNIDVIAGNTTTVGAEDATAEFRDDVSGTRLTLREGNASSAGVVFNAVDRDISVDTQIVGADFDQGVLRVVGHVAGSSVRQVTFHDEIGTGTGSDNRLFVIDVGRNGGSVADAERSGGAAVFKEDVRAMGLNIRGGNAANESSHATIEKDLNVAVVLLEDGGATAKLTIGGGGRATTTGDTGQTIMGNILAGGDGEGEIVVDNRGDAGTGRTNNNKVTFTGSIGEDDRALRQLTLTDGKTTFNGNVYARNIDVNTDDVTTFKGDVKTQTRFHLGANSGSVTFASRTAQEVTGRLTTQTAGRGEIIVTNKAGVTFKNDVGTSVAKLNNLTLTGDATAANASRATFAGHVYLAGGLSLGQNTRITLNGTSAQTVTGDLTSASGGNYGDITINNSAGVTFTGSLGTSGAHNGLNQLSLNANAKATFNNNVYLANGLSLGNGSRITLGGSGNQTFKGAITNSAPTARGSLVVNNTGGTVIFEDTVGVSGNGGDLARVTVSDGVAQFKGNVFAQGIALHSTDGAEFKGDVTTGTGGILFTGDNAAKMTLNGDDDQEVTGDITADFDGRGLLVVHNTGTNKTVTFGGSVGADGTALQQITLSGGKATFNGGVYADTITINTSDATTFKGHVKAQTKFELGNGSSVTFNGTTAQTITGDITSASRGNYGTIIIANRAGVTFADDLGARGNNNALASVSLNDDAKAAFQGDVYLNGNLTLGSNAQITVNGSGDQQIAATITNGGNDGRGDLVVNNSGGTVTFANAVGASGGALNQIKLDDGTTVFSNAVHANTITVNSADGTTFNAAVSATTFKFGSTATADSRVTFGGSTARTLTPAITTDAANSGAITVANTGGVTFKGDLGTSDAKLASLTLDANTTATLEKSGYFAGDVSIGNGATLTIGGTGRVAATNDVGQTMTGNIVAGGDGQGALVVNNLGDGTTNANNDKVTFTGSVGAGNAALNSVTLRAGATIFNGDLFARTIDVNTTGNTTFKGDVNAGTRFQFGASNNVTFNGTAAQTITGDITRATGASAVNFTIVNSAGVTFAGQLGESTARLNSLTLNEEAKVTFNAPVYLSGDLTLNKNTTITLGSAFGKRMGGDANMSFLTIGGDVDFGTADADNKVTIVLPVSFTTGTQKLINKDLSTEIAEGGKLVFRESTLVNYAFDVDGMTIMATAKGLKSANDVASKLGVSSSEASALLAAASAVKALPDESPVRQLLQEVAQLGNEAKAKRLAEQLAPQTTALSGATMAVVSTGTQVAGVFSDRLSAQRSGGRFAATEQSGFATGGHGMNRAFWLKPFGSWGKQSKNKKENIAGYSTSAKGLAVGVDAPVGDKARVGTAVAYSTSRITGKGAGQDKTDVRSWQVSLYGDYSTARYYVEGQLGVGRNDVSTASRIATLTRKADYDTTSVTASVGGGVPLNLTAHTTLTPTAGVSWTRVGSANYTTKGASVLNQKIAVESIDAVVGTLGTQLQRKITRRSGTLIPTARVGLSYDFAGEQTTASGTFTGGGDKFTVKGAKTKKLSGTAGLGLTYAGPRWSIGAEYDLTTRPGYQGHTARLNAKVKF